MNNFFYQVWIKMLIKIIQFYNLLKNTNLKHFAEMNSLINLATCIFVFFVELKSKKTVIGGGGDYTFKCF